MTSDAYQWVQAGFFLVSEGTSRETQRALLPERIITVSRCIVHTYPGAWALPWIDTTADRVDEVRESLAIEDWQPDAIRSWVAGAIAEKRFGDPSVFLSLSAAREFRSRFLGAAKGVRLIGLSLETQIAVEFIRDEEPGTGSGVGVWTALTQDVRLNPRGALRGFDVLGMEDDGSFHSFSCNDLALTFAQKFGIVFNGHGLIDNYVKAVAASDYANEDEAGAERVPWYPFRVDEYHLDDDQ